MLPGSSLLKLYAVLENELDLNAFKAGDVHLWPIARSCFGSKQIDNNARSEERTAEQRRVDTLIADKYDALMVTAPPAPDRDVAHFDAQALPHVRGGEGILVFTRPEDHYLRGPNGFFSPVLDPWVEIGTTIGPCRKIEIDSPRSQVRMPRILDVERISVPKSPSALTPEIHDLLRAARTLAMTVMHWLESELGYVYAAYAEDLQSDLVELWAEKCDLAAILKQRRPALVLTSCSYFPPTSSMTWAARECGILVGDIQHGGNGPFEMGYTHWRNVPVGGYQALPDFYLVWDAMSANNISRWHRPGNLAHQTIVSGRFDLEIAKRMYLEESGASPLDLLTYNSEKTILVSLQPLPSTGLTPLLLETMKRAPAGWTWLIRSHPMSVAWNIKDLMPDAIEHKLREAGVFRAEARMSTGLPLAAVLPVVDYHVTGFSGAVQECAAFGIHTTFVHPSAHFQFPQYIAAGAADFATTPDEILAQIAEPRTKDASSAFIPPTDPQRPLRILTEMLS